MSEKWRVTKRAGRWMVKRPGGAHFGAFFTWREAVAQVCSRLTAQPNATSGGYFEMRHAYDYDDHPWREAFGFAGPVLCESKSGGDA